MDTFENVTNIWLPSESSPFRYTVTLDHQSAVRSSTRCKWDVSPSKRPSICYKNGGLLSASTELKGQPFFGGLEITILASISLWGYVGRHTARAFCRHGNTVAGADGEVLLQWRCWIGGGGWSGWEQGEIPSACGWAPGWPQPCRGPQSPPLHPLEPSQAPQPRRGLKHSPFYRHSYKRALVHSSLHGKAPLRGITSSQSYNDRTDLN